MVGLAALPLQPGTSFAESCELVGSNGSMLINEGSGKSRSWRINIDGVTYQSDVFDKLTKQNRSKSTKKGKKSKAKETVFTFKDAKGVTRTPNNDVVKSIEATIKGEINESTDSGFVVIKDRTNSREYRIEDPASGLQVNCG